jgi:hypothetical protein
MCPPHKIPHPWWWRDSMWRLCFPLSRANKLAERAKPHTAKTKAQLERWMILSRSLPCHNVPGTRFLAQTNSQNVQNGTQQEAKAQLERWLILSRSLPCHNVPGTRSFAQTTSQNVPNPTQQKTIYSRITLAHCSPSKPGPPISTHDTTRVGTRPRTLPSGSQKPPPPCPITSRITLAPRSPRKTRPAEFHP